MKIGILFFFKLLAVFMLPPQLLSHTNLTPNDKLLLGVTIPKAGTHLLRKAISLISKDELDIGCITHLTPLLISSSVSNDRYAKILLIRDPRDIMISQLFWFRAKNYYWPPNTLVSDEFSNLSFEDQLNYIINFPKDSCGIREYSQMAIEWMQDPSVFVCRFEHLIGPEGGGNRLQQEKTIDALGRYLGYTLSSEEIMYVADHLFGKTATFREGKIGSWKTYFSPRHKELFKYVMGKELIELGYENKENW